MELTDIRPIALDTLLESVNIAEEMNDQELGIIGQEVVAGFEADMRSREEWTLRMEDAMLLATQVVEAKSTPWENAANVKYPLLTTAAIQFSARALPSLIPGDSVVNGKVIGKDVDGQKTARADRISKHMSFQFLEQMEDWEDEFDRALLTLPIMGCVFKKVHYSPDLKAPLSELVMPWDLVFDYWSKGGVRRANRITHRLYMGSNEILSNMRRGTYLNLPIEEFRNSEGILDEPTLREEVSGENRPFRTDESREVLEMCLRMDLDGDDYEEPYLVTVDRATRKVLRIVANYDVQDIEWNDKVEIVSIKPIQYYSDYIFIPDPNGGNLGMGFGTLLSPINETVNTLINQLLDAGTLQTHKSGYLGSALRLREGDTRFELGEWKVVRSSGIDLRQQIMPIPSPEPSQVLFLLLQLLVESGERLSSVTDTMAGDNPPANQPASTTLALIEQGLTVFTAVYKRIYRALKREFKLVYKLNGRYLKDEEYFAVLDEADETGMISAADYRDDGTDIIPSADPKVSTRALKSARVQAMVEGLGLGLNPEEVKKRYVESLEVPNPELLLQPPPPPPPDPKIQLEQAKLEMAKQDQQMELAKVQAQMNQERAELELKVQEQVLEAEKSRLELENERKLTNLEMEKTRVEIDKLRAEIEKIRAAPVSSPSTSHK